MLADQFAAAAAARNTAAVDEVARLTWRAHAEGQLADADAEAVSEALQARRAAFATRRTQVPVRTTARCRNRLLVKSDDLREYTAPGPDRHAVPFLALSEKTHNRLANSEK